VRDWGVRTVGDQRAPRGRTLYWCASSFSLARDPSPSGDATAPLVLPLLSAFLFSFNQICTPALREGVPRRREQIVPRFVETNHQKHDRQILSKREPYVPGFVETKHQKHDRQILLAGFPSCEASYITIQPFYWSSGSRPELTLPPLYLWQVKHIAAGGMHSVVVGVDGTVFTCGVNNEGALGRNTGQSATRLVYAHKSLSANVSKRSATIDCY